MVSYGHECPSHGVYARITEVKHWIQYVAGGAVDSNCDDQIPLQQGRPRNRKTKMAYRAVDCHNMMGGRGFRVEQLKIQTFVFRFLGLVTISSVSTTTLHIQCYYINVVKM